MISYHLTPPYPAPLCPPFLFPPCPFASPLSKQSSPERTAGLEEPLVWQVDHLVAPVRPITPSSSTYDILYTSEHHPSTKLSAIHLGHTFWKSVFCLSIVCLFTVKTFILQSERMWFIKFFSEFVLIQYKFHYNIFNVLNLALSDLQLPYQRNRWDP